MKHRYSIHLCLGSCCCFGGCFSIAPSAARTRTQLFLILNLHLSPGHGLLVTSTILSCKRLCLEALLSNFFFNCKYNIPCIWHYFRSWEVIYETSKPQQISVLMLNFIIPLYEKATEFVQYVGKEFLENMNTRVYLH